jgi:hypothetical protein
MGSSLLFVCVSTQWEFFKYGMLRLCAGGVAQSAAMFVQQQPQQDHQAGETLQSAQSDFLSFQLQPHLHQQSQFDEVLP